MGMTSKFGADYGMIDNKKLKDIPADKDEIIKPHKSVRIINKCSTKIGDITVQNYFQYNPTGRDTVKRLGNIPFTIKSKNVKIHKAGTATPPLSGIIGSGIIQNNDTIEITNTEGPNKNQYNFYYNVIRKGNYVITKAPLKKSI